MRVEMELRNLPLFRLMEYLVEAGGQLNGERAVSGAGWSAVLEKMEPAYVGKLRVPRDLLVIEGEDTDEVERVKAFMRHKTMRGGG